MNNSSVEFSCPPCKELKTLNLAERGKETNWDIEAANDL